MSVLAMEAIEVSDSTIEARVRVLDPEFMRTSVRPGLAEDALALLPGLARHTCENDRGARFVDELRDTETPHLLEHVTTELAALAGSPRSLRAQTTWDFPRDGRGVFVLRFAYDDDLVVLGALKAATDIVDWLVRREGERPDVEATVDGLQALRSRDLR